MTDKSILREYVDNQDHRLEQIERLLYRTIEQNSELIREADSRLDRANLMVLKLTESINGLRELCEDLEKQYMHYIDRACSSRDVAISENVEMRKELSSIRGEMLDALKEIARRPTINNSNSKI